VIDKPDDGGDKPLGYVTEDGCLEVRESVDLTGKPFRGYHETELGLHMRWMRQAPDLYERYQQLIDNNSDLHHRFAVMSASLRQLLVRCLQLQGGYEQEGQATSNPRLLGHADALGEIANMLREELEELGWPVAPNSKTLSSPGMYANRVDESNEGGRK
jgi:hypothetical protein